MTLDMSKLGYLGLRQNIQEQYTNANQAIQHGGTGVNAPVVPNQRREDAAGDQSGQGGSGGQTDHQARSLGGFPRTGGVTETPWIGGDSPLRNIGINGRSTYQAGTMQRTRWRDFGATNNMHATMASLPGGEHKLSVARVSRRNAQQVKDNVDFARVQDRPWHRDRTAFNDQVSRGMMMKRV
jgi:hypothetical protein